MFYDEKEIQKLNIQPKASVYGTFARYNYKPWYAIAEFVDNSTASYFEHKKSLTFFSDQKLIIDIVYDPDAGTIRVTDNAYGMEYKDFIRAIKLDSRPENNTGRNEFGMGLKTAASWFGKVWKVTSTQLNSTNKYTATVDIPKLDREDLNDVDIVKTQCARSEHGTIIEIGQLNRQINAPKTISKIKKVLTSMYRRDLADDNVVITWQGQPLKFTPYEVLTSNEKEWRKNLDFNFEFAGINHRVTGFVGILGDKDSGFIKAGLALFRRNRVVIGCEGDYYKPADIFGQAQSPVSHKLFGELDLDDFQINQAKDGFIWEDGLEDEFISQLKIQIHDYIRYAAKKIKDRDSGFDEKDSKSIAEMQELTQKSLENLRFSEQEKAKSIDYKTEEEKEFDDAFVFCEDKEECFEATSKIYLIPKGPFNSENIKVTWTSAGTSYWYAYDASTKEIKINIEHPFFKPFSTQPKFRIVLQKIVLALVISENRAEETSGEEGFAYIDDINNNINEILKVLIDNEE